VPTELIALLEAGAVTVVVSVEQAEEEEEEAESVTRLRVPAVEIQLAPG